MPGIYNSGKQVANAQIIDQKFFYKGAILIGEASGISSLIVYNCSSTGTLADTDIVAELSVTAKGQTAVDNLHGAIECPNGIRTVIVGACRYHVRGCAVPS